MPRYYSYSQVIRETQSTVNGNPHNYAGAAANGATWSYSGSMITTNVREEDNSAVNFNGDEADNNEGFTPLHDIGGAGQQTMNIDGVDRAVIYDYSFTVSDGTNTYEIAVIDADLDGDSFANTAGEDGYYLIFIGTPPPPNTNLTVTEGVTDNSTSRAHSDLGGQIVCFLRGTLIQTATGPRPIEALRPGDMIQTYDNGLQPLMMMAMRRVSGRGDFAPVRIGQGAMGNARDLWVSPQHRMLLSDWQVELAFGEKEVFLPATALVGQQGITRQMMPEVLYCHMLFEAHQVVFAEGTPSESLHPGPQALAGMAPESVAELRRLFPELDPRDPRCGDLYGPLARPAARARDARVLRLG